MKTKAEKTRIWYAKNKERKKGSNREYYKRKLIEKILFKE